MDRKLINAVIKQLGHSPEDLKDKGGELVGTLEDVARQGIDSGFSGFIYTLDAVNFYRKNRALIVAELEELAADLGENPLEMVAGFNCLKSDKLSTLEVASALFALHNERYDGIYNALAWFAAEEVARHITDGNDQ